MVRDVYVNMVEDIIGILFRIFARNDACILRISILINVAAHRKSCSAILLARLNWVTPGNLRFFIFGTSNIENNYYGNETHWHVVDNPMMLVVHSHSFSQLRKFFLTISIHGIICPCAQSLAFTTIMLKCYLKAGNMLEICISHLSLET